MVKIKIAVARGKVVIGKLFLVVLGGVIGSTGVYVSLTAPDLLKPHNIVIENVRASSSPEVKVESTEDIIRRVGSGFPEIETLVKIAKCESGLDRLAQNKVSSATGVFQILSIHKMSIADRFNVEKSTKWAISEVNKNGFRAWSESKSCWSK